jgi:hypothetical protein
MMVKAKMEPAHAVTLDKHAGGHWRAVDAAQVHVGPAGVHGSAGPDADLLQVQAKQV